jgi:hypothetical protein
VTQAGNPMFEGQTLLIVGLIGGFVVVPMVANVAPVFVNGLLLLVLTGTLLFNSDRWLPYLAGFSELSAKASGRPTPSSGGGPNRRIAD